MYLKINNGKQCKVNIFMKSVLLLYFAFYIRSCKRSNLEYTYMFSIYELSTQDGIFEEFKIIKKLK